MRFWQLMCFNFTMEQMHYARRWANEWEEHLFSAQGAEDRIGLGEFVRLCEDGTSPLEDE